MPRTKKQSNLSAPSPKPHPASTPAFQGFQCNHVSHQAALHFAKHSSWPTARQVAFDLLAIPDADYNNPKVVAASRWIVDTGTAELDKHPMARGQSWFQVDPASVHVIALKGIFDIDEIIEAVDFAVMNLDKVIESIQGITATKLALMQVALIVAEIPRVRFRHSDGSLTQIGVDNPRFIDQYRGDKHEVDSKSYEVTEKKGHLLTRTKSS